MLFEIANLENIIETQISDIRDYKALSQSINNFNPDIVFHLAAQPLVRRSYKSPIETYETNVMGTANFLDISRKSSSIKAVINITTDKCYENREKIIHTLNPIQWVDMIHTAAVKVVRNL